MKKVVDDLANRDRRLKVSLISFNLLSLCKTILAIRSTCVGKSFSSHPVLIAVGVGAGGEWTRLHLGFALFGIFLFYLNFLFGLFSLPIWTL